jgi:hypothetical protein
MPAQIVFSPRSRSIEDKVEDAGTASLPREGGPVSEVAVAVCSAILPAVQASLLTE